MRDDVFKVKVEEHGYLDRILFGKLTTPAIDWAKKKNLTPNYLTTCSFISQLVSIYFLYHKYKFCYSFFYILGYYFDCIDGPMARKYDMVTTFGDWYDHVTDIFCFIVTNYLYVTKYKLHHHYFIVSLFLVQMYGLINYVGCQESIFNEGLENQKKRSGSLYLTTYFVKNKPIEKQYKILIPFCFTHSVILYSLIPHFL